MFLCKAFVFRDDLQQLPYLTMCIKESLRLYSIPVLEKKLDEDVVVDGKLVPAETLVLINLFGLHRNPQIWKDPSVRNWLYMAVWSPFRNVIIYSIFRQKFDPERFSAEKIEQMDPYAFIPFLAGSR